MQTAEKAPTGFRIDDDAARNGVHLWRGPQLDLGRVKIVTDFTPEEGVTVSVLGDGAGGLEAMTLVEVTQLRAGLTRVLAALAGVKPAQL